MEVLLSRVHAQGCCHTLRLGVEVGVGMSVGAGDGVRMSIGVGNGVGIGACPGVCLCSSRLCIDSVGVGLILDVFVV